MSRAQHDVEQTRRLYLRALQWISLVTFPGVVLLFFLAEPLIAAVFGQDWLPTVPILRILCVCSLLQCLYQANGWVVTAQGRTDLMFRLGVLWTAGVVVSFVIGLEWGLTGVAAGYAVCNVVMAVPLFFASGRLIRVSPGDVLRALAGGGIAAGLAGAVVWAVESRLRSDVGAPLQLVVGGLTGVVAYLVALYFVSPTAYRQLRNLRA